MTLCVRVSASLRLRRGAALYGDGSLCLGRARTQDSLSLSWGTGWDQWGFVENFAYVTMVLSPQRPPLTHQLPSRMTYSKGFLHHHAYPLRTPRRRPGVTL